MSLLLYDPAPLRLLSSAVRAESQRIVPSLYAVLDLAAPGGTLRWSPEAVASAASGQYSGRLMSVGSAVQAIDLSSPRLNDLQLTVRIADTDQMFAKRHAAYRNSLRGSAATIRVLSPRVPDSDALVGFVGILDSYQMIESSAWELRLRTDDVALKNTDIPRLTINRGDWPNAHADALNKAAPVLWGDHNSANLSGKGMVDCHCVDTVAYKYAPSLGVLANVRALYKDGVKQTTGWSVAPETRNARTWTVVTLASSAGDSAITADVEGVTNIYDGSGAEITNPVRQIEHMLTCFVFSNWTSGAYPTTTRIDRSTFAQVADWMDARGHRGSLTLGGGEKERALAVFERWCVDFGVYPYWTLAGTIGLGVLDWAPPAGYPELLLKETDLRGPVKCPFDASQLTRELALRYCYDSSEGEYKFERLVSDISVVERVSASRDMRYGKAGM